MYSNGVVLEGRDYGHIIELGHKLSYPDEDRITGFITHTGEFVLPSEAAEIAVRSKQLKEKLSVVTPEVLWPATEVYRDAY